MGMMLAGGALGGGNGRDDFYAWALDQALLLRCGLVQGLDLDGLASHVEAMADRERRACRVLVRRVLSRLALCEFSGLAKPKGRWLADAVAALHELGDVMTPSLAERLRPEMGELYRSAASEASAEVADLGGDPSLVPAECPFTWDEVFGPEGRLPF